MTESRRALQGRCFFADFSSASNIGSLRFDDSDPADFDGTNFSDLEAWMQRLAPARRRVDRRGATCDTRPLTPGVQCIACS